MRMKANDSTSIRHAVAHEHAPSCEVTPRCEREEVVTVGEIREFVQAQYDRKSNAAANNTCHEILDFIDNGPKKPTAEEVARKAIAENTLKGERYADIAVRALREAGYLKEDV